MVEKKIGKRFQQYRKRSVYTQQALAEELDISTNYVSAIERGANQPEYNKLVNAINLFGCSADDIFCDVVDDANKSRTCRLWEELQSLPKDEQDRAIAIPEAFISSVK